MDNTEVYWVALYVGSFILILNGFAEFIGRRIKENGRKLECKEHATAFLRIGFGILFLFVGGVLIWFSN